MPKTQKTKTEKIAHPYSRKAMKEERRLLHKNRVDQGRQERSSKLDTQAERLLWFHERLDERQCYSKSDLLHMLEQFRNRFDDELEQIAIVNSVGSRKGSKQHASREAAIKMTQDMEKNEFESVGIEVPDLCSKDNLRNFRLWGGEMKYVQNLKMKRISVRDKEKLEAANSAADCIPVTNDSEINQTAGCAVTESE
ncbi:translation machinery-associated protein 16-like [Babylonia areolata]|uniref:translation machinery-associated protein 16-like n=1 Tax=Babylonia areolata TaxID=304850 RepID=UPI003FD2D2FF